MAAGAAGLARLRAAGTVAVPEVPAHAEHLIVPVPGRHERVSLHQLHPLLVHAVLFGGSYGRTAGLAARQALALTGGRRDSP